MVDLTPACRYLRLVAASLNIGSHFTFYKCGVLGSATSFSKLTGLCFSLTHSSSLVSIMVVVANLAIFWGEKLSEIT